ncbi:MAG: 1,4-dihydroxy-2-naphthoate polyprenyltransferase [Planctomycetota bacterium]|nr:1,4-dihydroxy-2-naphthoate polyprenyltransferase [Planctomycetota bacterium]
MVNTISVTRRIKYSMMKHWLLAARPKTLLAALSPVAIGTQMALVDGAFSLSALLATLLCAISIQVGTNFCNDYCDFRQGADTKSRKGPARAVQSGFISPRAMLIATIIAFAITGGSAWLLYLRAGLPFLLLGALSIILGIAYTAGRFSLAYLGIADPFVLIFFGPVAVAGTQYLQSLQFDETTILAGLGPGLISTGLLVVNNLRDIDEDRIAAKRTLAVRFGATFSRYQYAACILGAAVVPLIFAINQNSWPPALASLIIIPGLLLIRKVGRSSGTELRPCLGMTAGVLLLFTILFCFGLGLG